MTDARKVARRLGLQRTRLQLLIRRYAIDVPSTYRATNRRHA